MNLCTERDAVFVTISGMYSRRERCVLGEVVYFTRVPLPTNTPLSGRVDRKSALYVILIVNTAGKTRRIAKYIAVWTNNRLSRPLNCQHGKKVGRRRLRYGGRDGPEGGIPYLLRLAIQSLGVWPVIFLNTLLKEEALMKPQACATSVCLAFWWLCRYCSA